MLDIINFLKNLLLIATKRPGSFWMLGNIRPIEAAAALFLPALLGALIGGLVAWYVARRRRAAAILRTLAAGYSRFSFWLSDGALYVDGVKGRYVSATDFSSGPTSPAFEIDLNTKKARKMLDRAGYECLD